MPNSLAAVLRECHEKKLHVTIMLLSNGSVHVSDGRWVNMVDLERLVPFIRRIILGYKS